MNQIDLSQSLFLRACRGEKNERPPVWFMRQAGRYLPEYRAVRAEHSMLDVIRTPELAAKVTLQPIDRFGFDASIIFADILNPLIGMGADLAFVEKEGPRISNPVRSAADVERLTVPPPEENVGYTLEAIRMVSKELSPRGVPLIGFSGAPFTLSAYLIEGGSIESLSLVKQMLFTEPALWHRLQEKLVVLVSEYLIAQARAGASALQLFDSWLGFAGPALFEEFIAPYLKEIVARVKSAVSVPFIFFSTGTTGLFHLLAPLGFDVFGVDWRVSLPFADQQFGSKFPLQGNLDPLLLHGSPERLQQEVSRVLREGETLRGHIFNLGHGILPQAPIPAVEQVLAQVKEGRKI